MLNQAVEFATTPISKLYSKKGVAAMGVGATAMNLYDIYEACENHEEVLDVLEDRYNRVLGPDTTPIEWFDKIKELFEKGDSFIGAYVSGYAGQAGENAVVQMFESQGENAQLFESRTHPNDDVRVTHPDGSVTDYSVKSYANMDDFLSVVKDHPDSTHYAVNSELYKELENNGMLERLQSEGITIIDGNFSHELNRDIAESAFADIDEAGDFDDDISDVAHIFFGYKALKNVHQFIEGKQSLQELGINVTADIVRIGVGGLFATGGAQIGAAIGTMIAPGLGTIIGGGVGAVVGTFGGLELFQWAKERLKWGDTIDAIDYFGNAYNQGFTDFMRENIKDYILNRKEIAEKLKEEKKLKEKYREQLSPYSSSPVSLPGILSHLYTQNLKAALEKTDNSIKYSEEELLCLCQQAGNKLSQGDPEKADKFGKRFWGEIIAANAEVLFGDNLAKTDDYYQKYQNNMRTAPNHPYRFSVDTKTLLQGVCIKHMNEYPLNPSLRFSPNMWVLGLAMTGLAVSYIIFKFSVSGNIALF